MTEAEWLACNEPQRMLKRLGVKPPDRKLLLWQVACCRRAWGLLPAAARAYVEVCERLADGRAGEADVAAGPGAGGCGEAEAFLGEDFAAQARLVRCVFGNPFRPAPRLDPAWLAWDDGAARKLAEAAYDERAFDRLPVLADALEDAGCTDPELLGHLRSGGEHARGCWAVDLLLGKE
jgi:hypothetical protein